MKATDLERIINGINRKYLDELCGPLPGGNEGAEKVASRQVPPSGKPICGDAGCFGGVASSPCFCGITNGGYHNGSELEEVIILRDPNSNPPEGKVAVVATIDDATKPSGEDKDLPVVLAVGINYGQGANYLANPSLVWNSTRMRARLDQAVALAESTTEKNCAHPPFPKPGRYHLVATNFFPWITQESWSDYGFNSIEEMLLIHCHGFRDPFAHIEAICRRLEKELYGLVLHGAKNAVPLLGAEFLRTCMASEWRENGPDIVFCDNLAPSQNPKIYNAVRICRLRSTRTDAENTEAYDG